MISLNPFRRFKDLQRRENEVLKKLELINDKECRTKAREASLEIKSKSLRKREEALVLILHNHKEALPWLSGLYKDYEILLDDTRIEFLTNKSRPALKAADIVSQIKTEKSKLVSENIILKHTIKAYELIQPDLIDYEDYTDFPVEEYYDDESGDPVRAWLSKNEYSSLAENDKYQLALDRYLNRNKSKSEIGKSFERYVGYLYEIDGYTVDYYGIKNKLSDFGIDLICCKNGITKIIQCKYWSSSKLIRENVVNQLYGTTLKFAIENFKLKESLSRQLNCFDYQVYPIIYTSTQLSEDAKYFCKILNVDYFENIRITDYPVIKCHLNENGDKIYHLPFDLQYDRIKNDQDGRLIYVGTIIEAENLGYRRAKKWFGK